MAFSRRGNPKLLLLFSVHHSKGSLRVEQIVIGLFKIFEESSQLFSGMGFLDFIHFCSRQRIATFVFGMTSVSLEPLPLHVVELDAIVKFPPEIGIFDRFAGTSDPAFHTPRVNPLRDSFSEILGVRVDEYLAGFREQLECRDGGA